MTHIAQRFWPIANKGRPHLTRHAISDLRARLEANSDA